MAANRNEVFNLVKKCIEEVLPEVDGEVVSSEARLADLGANSVDRAEIVMMAMEGLDLDVPRSELATVSNIGELVDVLCAKSLAH